MVVTICGELYTNPISIIHYGRWAAGCLVTVQASSNRRVRSEIYFIRYWTVCCALPVCPAVNIYFKSIKLTECFYPIFLIFGLLVHYNFDKKKNVCS